MIRQSICVSLFSLMALFSTSVAAQSVMLLKTDSNLSEEDVLKFESKFSTALNQHPDFEVSGKRDLTISELALGAGCAEPDVQCLEGLGKLIKSDFLAYATLNEDDEQSISANIRIYSFAGSFHADRGAVFDRDEFEAALSALVSNAVWGETGEIQVSIDSSDDAVVFLDSQEIGLGSGPIENVAYGKHVVEVESGGVKQSREVLVTPGNVATAAFVFASAENVASESGPSIVPGVVTIVAGLGAIGFGVFMSSSLNSDQNEIERIETTYGNESCACFDSDFPDSEREKLIDLDESRNTKTILQFVGYGTGVALTGIGTYLLIRALGTTEDASETAIQLNAGPTKDGAYLEAKVRF